MNPRIEQSCVTVSDALFDFYDVYLHEVLQQEEARYTARETMKMQMTKDGDLTDDERTALLGQD